MAPKYLLTYEKGMNIYILLKIYCIFCSKPNTEFWNTTTAFVFLSKGLIARSDIYSMKVWSNRRISFKFQTETWKESISSLRLRMVLEPIITFQFNCFEVKYKYSLCIAAFQKAFRKIIIIPSRNQCLYNSPGYIGSGNYKYT